MGAATPARAEGGVLMQAAVPDSGASLQQPKQARAAAAPPESYLRLEIHVENGQLSVAGIKEVAGPLAVPTSVIHGYVYEALVGGQQVAIGSVPDVGVRRAFANRDVPGKEGKHNFVPVPEFDFYVRVPKAQLSIASLPAMVVILHNVRSVPDRIESATPLALQPGVQSDEVGRLGGVQLQRLEPAVRAQFEVFVENALALAGRRGRVASSALLRQTGVMDAPGLILYELAGADPALRFSPHCWKTRMALAHKGLDATRLPWRFTERERIAFSEQALVPVLVDGDTVVSDSWRIACYLEERYPERPSLFGGARAVPLTRFVNRWADMTLVPAITRIILLDIYARLDERDRDYFRTSREARLGAALEQVVTGRPAHLATLRHALRPVRQELKADPFLCGDAPGYADYCVFGMFMWARCTSPIELLEEDDPMVAWRERLLDASGGMPRSAPSAQDGAAGAHRGR